MKISHQLESTDLILSARLIAQSTENYIWKVLRRLIPDSWYLRNRKVQHIHYCAKLGGGFQFE